MPAGVVPSPSWRSADSPLRPTRAVKGPAAGSQQPSRPPPGAELGVGGVRGRRFDGDQLSRRRGRVQPVCEVLRARQGGGRGEQREREHPCRVRWSDARRPRLQPHCWPRSRRPRRPRRRASRRRSIPCAGTTCATPTVPAVPSRLRSCARLRSRTGTSTAARRRDASSSHGGSPVTSSRSSAACGRRAFRFGACGRCRRFAGMTTRRWPPTTPLASTAASSRGRPAGRCTPSARRST